MFSSPAQEKPWPLVSGKINTGKQSPVWEGADTVDTEAPRQSASPLPLHTGRQQRAGLRAASRSRSQSVSSQTPGSRSLQLSLGSRGLLWLPHSSSGESKALWGRDRARWGWVKDSSLSILMGQERDVCAGRRGLAHLCFWPCLNSGAHFLPTKGRTRSNKPYSSWGHWGRTDTKKLALAIPPPGNPPSSHIQTEP